jgi:hypothetical protein
MKFNPKKAREEKILYRKSRLTKSTKPDDKNKTSYNSNHK